MAALAAEHCAVVLDDVHHLAPDAAQLATYTGGRLVREQRLVVLGRRLQRGAEKLCRAKHLQLSAADLRLNLEECRVLSQGFGLADDEDANSPARARRVPPRRCRAR